MTASLPTTTATIHCHYKADFFSIIKSDRVEISEKNHLTSGRTVGNCTETYALNMYNEFKIIALTFWNRRILSKPHERPPMVCLYPNAKKDITSRLFF